MSFKLQTYSFRRRAALTLASILIFESIFPPFANALTNGPSSPEFSKFEPVSSSDMVNLFSGDFTYNLPVLNIPGPDGAGYAMSLSYQSGVNAEMESSWVGFGFTMNAGSLQRITKGIPDDFKGSKIIKYNKSRPNWSLSGFTRLGTEVFGSNLGINATKSIRINNYTGLYSSYGLGLQLKGVGGINFNKDAQGITAKANLNPSILFTKKKKDADEKSNDDKLKLTRKEVLEKLSSKETKVKKKLSTPNLKSSALSVGSNFNIFLPGSGDITRSSNFTKYWGVGFNFSMSGQINPSSSPVGVEAGFGASFNFQKNISKTEHTAYGYMHNRNFSQSEDLGSDLLSDYHVEKGGSFTKRDYHLGIPFSDPDIYTLSGEGLGGSFRYWREDVGHYYPSFGRSHFGTISLGIEGMIGADVGLGLNLGGGYSTSKMGSWASDGNTSNRQFSNSGGHFRFTNDLGGSIQASADTDAVTANIFSSGGPNLDLNNVDNNFTSSGTSSLIEYQTYDQYLDASQRFDGNHTPQNLSDVTSDAICGFRVTNADGAKYVYGLPVFNRHEGSNQISVESIRNNHITQELDVADSDVIYNNHLAYLDVDFTGTRVDESTESKSVFGEYMDSSYVGTHLLTQILTHDYFDSNQNGKPDNSDYGGWTNFHYHKKHGYGQSSFYNWRSPYTGQVYSKNQISDVFDDLGSLSFGEKEVYYMKAVETKSHIALFITNETDINRFDDIIDITQLNSHYVTGSGDLRKDGLDANIAGACNDLQAKGTNRLEFLEKIVLFSKGRLSKPIKTIHFEYDYSLCKNLPNNEYGTYPSFSHTNSNISNSGKLTLKKVWFTYEGQFVTRISPYVFDYVYDNFRNQNNELKIHGKSRDKYQDIIGHANQFSYEQQNPNYNNEYLDAWGNIAPFQKERNEKLRKWPYQGEIDQGEYDPAAWHLKKITLPLGGEIHVQYEAKNYKYVQNRRTTTLVSLKNNIGESEFIINGEDTGVVTNDDKLEYIEILENHFNKTGNKVFFKFLYDMTENNPSIHNCHSEYIDGWAILDTIVYNGSDIVIKLDDGELTEGDSWLPRRACYDYFSQNFYGKLSNVNNCTVLGTLPLAGLIDGFSDITLADIPNAARQILESFVDLIEMFVWGIPVYQDYCMEIDPEMSYLKLPSFNPLTGGGVRVKNLLLFDPGLEDGDAKLYGHSYEYKNIDGESSGVATNEPSNMRDGSALIEFMPRKGQSWYSKLTTGEDKNQTTGPLGESLLPSPSVGFSRVKVEHIHMGQSSTGFTVHEFHTTKDFPFDKIYPVNQNSDLASNKGVDFTELEDNYDENILDLPLVFFNYKLNAARAAQGYRFIINNMNGQPMRNSTYGISQGNEPFLVASEQIEYYDVGEMVPILKDDLSVVHENPGKELDITMEMKKASSDNFDLELEADVSMAVLPPVYVTIVPSFSMSQSSLATHTTSKVVNYPAIQKKVTQFQEGIYSSMENIAFSDHTGKPLIQKITDDLVFGGIMIYRYSTSIPASYHYSNMGQKTHNNVSNSNRLNIIASEYQTYDHNPISTGNLNLDNILQVSETTFATGNDVNFYDFTVPQDVKDIYRAHKSYAYKAPTTNALSTLGNKINNAGIIDNFIPFDHQNPPSTAPWITANEITKYSENGLALEEKNALGIYSSALLGYNNYVPILNAVNARKENILFESFEDSGIIIPQVKGHTGIRSKEIVSSDPNIIPQSIWDQDMVDRGAIIKLWVHSSEFDQDQIISFSINGLNYESKYIAKTGFWALHEVRIPDGEVSLPITSYQGIMNNTTTLIYVDDIKIQPRDSELKCFVYDPETLRLIAEMDDNHFALMYQYNDQGKLIRKIIETERGIQTVQETQYNTPKSN